MQSKFSIKFNELRFQNEEILDKFKNSLDDFVEESSFILGKQVLKLEEKLAYFADTKYCVGVGNGTDALEIAIRSLKLPKNSEVLIQGNTFIATAIAAIRAGLRIKWVDIDSDTLQINVEDIEKYIGKNTRLIIPVHLFGMSPNLHKIKTVAKNFKLSVISDCAQSLGGKFNGDSVLKFGDVATTSFYPGKNLGAWGDAGAIFTSNKQISNSCRKTRNYGSEIKYNHDEFGFNSRIDEIQSMILNYKLRYLKSWNTQRNHIANQYDKYFQEFERFEKIKIVRSEQLNEPARHLYPIRVMKDRDKIIQKLRLKGIECLVHYPTPLNKISWLKNYSTNHKLPIATEVSKQLISLPLFPGMSDNEIEYIQESFIKLVK